MKIKSSSLCWTLALTGALLPLASPAKAQNAVTPGASGRLSVVELRDTSLADALELIFKAAGNPSHIIDESAQSITIPSVTLNNIAWDAAVRNLANLNNFKVSRNVTGAWVVEPRAPVVPVDGMGEPGSDGNFGAPGGFPGASPANPFGGRPGGTGRRPRTQASPSIRTFSNAQTRGNFGGNRATANPNEGKEYKVIIVYHIYAGGLAQLFQNSSVIPTDIFVSPGQLGGGSGGNGGGGGNRGGGGGFGGGRSGIGGIGGGGGGFGGGGFGGGGGGIGGIGGGGFGGGGFGGGGGGFGGGFGF